MTLRELKAILRPTAQPIERPTDQQLLEAEANLGLLLPNDYRQFIQHYGTGSIEGFLRILNPSSKYANANLVAAARDDNFDGYRPMRSEWPEEYQFARYPEPGGLLPWSHSIDGDILYWLTQGDCDTWPIIVWSRGDRLFHSFNTSMVDFILDFVAKGAGRDLFGSSSDLYNGQYSVLSA